MENSVADPAIPAWLEPYTGFPGAPAPVDWTPYGGDAAPSAHFPRRFDLAELERCEATQVAYLRAILEEGAALVEGVPDEASGVFVRRFADDFLGGMQKEPTRDERNWRIVRRENAASISYDPAKRLYQHTDSSVPPHGIPALMLTMHYVEGYGANTLTDGFAVARDLRAADPEAFELLATHGVDAERDFAGSRADSVQAHKQGLVIKRKHPLFVCDENGELARVQYNEVFRTALSLPYDVFPKYYAAFSKFVEMLHKVRQDGDGELRPARGAPHGVAHVARRVAEVAGAVADLGRLRPAPLLAPAAAVAQHDRRELLVEARRRRPPRRACEARMGLRPCRW